MNNKSSIDLSSRKLKNVSLPDHESILVDKTKREENHSLHEDYKNNSNNILVSVRVRPLNNKELVLSDFETIRVLDKNFLVLLDPGKEFDQEDILRKNRIKETQFTFDYNFDKNSSQTEIYSGISPFLIDGILDGFNATIFAYGATGAGKTYTMSGTSDDHGIIPRAINDLMEKIEKNKVMKDFSVKASYLEIYNESIKDLLTVDDKNLEIREDPIKGIVVAGITEIIANNLSEIMTIMKIGSKNRSKEATGMNDISSRSHAVFQIIVEHKDKNQGIDEQINFAKFTLVDLAGSERAAATSNKGLRMIEGAKINQSLLILGNCIQALSEQTEKNNKGSFVPYRGSKLTRLLKDSLGGNCRTMMIANISPSVVSFEDTYNTLNFANRTKNIKTNVIRNVVNVTNHIANYVQIINSLKQENEDLKKMISGQKTNISNQPVAIQKLDSPNFVKFEKEIKEIFDEELELRQKFNDLNKKLEENRISIANLVGPDEKNLKKNKDLLDTKKNNFQTMLRARDDLQEEINKTIAKRGVLINSIKSSDLQELHQNYLTLLIKQNSILMERQENIDKEASKESNTKLKDLQISILNTQMKIRDQLIEDQRKLLESNGIPNKLSSKFNGLKSLNDIVEEAKLIFPSIEKPIVTRSSRSPKKIAISDEIKLPRIIKKRADSKKKPIKSSKPSDLAELSSLSAKNYLYKKPVYQLFENATLDQNRKKKKKVGYSQESLNASADSRPNRKKHNASLENNNNFNNQRQRSSSLKSNKSLSSTASSKLRKLRPSEKYEKYEFDKKFEEKKNLPKEKKHTFVHRNLGESPFLKNFKKNENPAEKKTEKKKETSKTMTKGIKVGKKEKLNY